MLSSAFTVFLFSTALACSPSGTEGTTSTSATFTMTVQPPGSWSHPLMTNQIRPPQISTTKEQAFGHIKQDILQAINVILIDNKYPVDAIKLTVDPVDIAGNIVTVAPEAQCVEAMPGLLVTGRTIDRRCTGTGLPQEFTQGISGKFDASGSGFAVTEAQWRSLGVKLQQALGELGAVFTENLVVTPTKA